MYVDKQILSAEVMKLCVHIWCSEMTNLITYIAWVGLWGCIIIFKVTFIIVNLDKTFPNRDDLKFHWNIDSIEVCYILFKIVLSIVCVLHSKFNINFSRVLTTTKYIKSLRYYSYNVGYTFSNSFSVYYTNQTHSLNHIFSRM
jgi:hypothetical protein